MNKVHDMQAPGGAGVSAVSAETLDLLRDYARIIAAVLGADDNG